MYKQSNMIDLAAKALSGSKNLSRAQSSLIKKYITEYGAVNPNLVSNRGFFKNLLLGSEHAPQITKARYLKGGVIGKGGLILGELAPSDEYIDSAIKFKDYLIDPAKSGKKFTSSDAKTLISGTPGNLLNVGFNVGLPIMEAREAYKGESEEYGDRVGEGTGAALGSGLGFLLANNYGLPLGMASSYVGKRIGSSIGKLFDSKKKERDPLENPNLAATRALL
jgi:hypothetical protein